MLQFEGCWAKKKQFEGCQFKKQQIKKLIYTNMNIENFTSQDQIDQNRYCTFLGDFFLDLDVVFQKIPIERRIEQLTSDLSSQNNQKRKEAWIGENFHDVNLSAFFFWQFLKKISLVTLMTLFLQELHIFLQFSRNSWCKNTTKNCKAPRRRCWFWLKNGLNQNSC